MCASPAGESTADTTTQAEGDCTDKQWAADVVANIATGVGLDPALLELRSCKPNPDFVSSGSTTTISSSTVQLRQLQQGGSCNNPAYLLEMDVVLGPSLDAEEYRWAMALVVVCLCPSAAALLHPSPATDLSKPWTWTWRRLAAHLIDNKC